MKELEFWGKSDDLAYCVTDGSDGTYEENEFDVPDEGVTLKLESGDDRMLVHLCFLPPPSSATWVVGVAPYSETQAIPDWPMRMRSQGYTAILEITVPEDTTVTDVSGLNLREMPGWR